MSRRSFPAAWLLVLLVPAGFFAGRLVGGMPVPAARPQANDAVAGQAPSPLAAPGAARDGSGVRWVALDAAIAESRRTGKPVLLDFNADWCPPCQRMKRDVFENPALARAVEAQVVPVSVVDRWRETGANPPEVEEMQRRFGIEAFPTLVAFSPATGRYVKDSGFGGAEYTVQWIAGAAKQVK